MIDCYIKSKAKNEHTKKVVKIEKEEYWVFENGMKYSKNRFTEVEAKSMYESCSNCANCTNCANCLDSEDCVDCVNCTNCGDCTNCANCLDSEDCINCRNCDDCVVCKDCIDCKGCSHSKDCSRNKYRYIPRKGVKKMELGLISGRHPLPVTGYIFNDSIEDVFDFESMQEQLASVLQGYTEVTVYVTGLTVVTVELIKFCASQNIKLTLMHYNSKSGLYIPQSV